MKSPDVLDRDRIGKHRAVGVELQTITENQDDKEAGPAKTGTHDQSSQDIVLVADSRSRRSLHCA